MSRPSKKSVADQQSVLARWSLALELPISEFVTERPAKAVVPFWARPETQMFRSRLRDGDTIITARFGHFFGTPEDAHATLTAARHAGYHFRAVDMQGGRVNLESTAPLMTALLAVSASSTYEATLRNRAVKSREAAGGRFMGGRKPTFGYDVVEGGLV